MRRSTDSLVFFIVFCAAFAASACCGGAADSEHVRQPYDVWRGGSERDSARLPSAI